MLDISVVVPVYNEEKNIVPLHGELKKTMDTLGREYEIIFINDGSSDSTCEVLGKLQSQDNSLTLVNFIKNRGQSLAFQHGFCVAQAKIVITMDADLQNDPRDIPRLLAKLEQGYDVVCGWRKNRSDPFSTRTASKTANLFRRLILGEKLHDANCSFRAYNREFLKDLDLSGNMYYMLTAILALRGANICELEVSHRKRLSGKTKFNICRRIAMFNIFLILRLVIHKGKYTRARI